jgi:hypothetical protein
VESKERSKSNIRNSEEMKMDSEGGKRNYNSPGPVED